MREREINRIEKKINELKIERQKRKRERERERGCDYERKSEWQR